MVMRKTGLRNSGHRIKNTLNGKQNGKQVENVAYLHCELSHKAGRYLYKLWIGEHINKEDTIE